MPRHARHGTTTIFPTTTTGTPEEIHAMIAACRQVRDDAAPSGGARIRGIHLYGSFFAPDKVGCHSAGRRRDPTPAEFSRHFDTGLVRIATCAAELHGALAFFRQAHREGCFITCGHSNASWTEMDRAYRAGMRHVDHFWCAMSSVASIRARLGTPMQGSMEQYVLMNDGMSTEVIADGQHLSPELLQFAYRVLGSRRWLLVTDACRAVDLAPGRYKFGHAITGTDFDHDGKVGRAPEGGLASASVGMDQVALANPRLRGHGFDLPEVAPIFEEYVEAAGVSDRLTFVPGSFFEQDLPRADVVMMGDILHDFDDSGADCQGWMREIGVSSTRVEPLVGPDSMVIGIT